MPQSIRIVFKGDSNKRHGVFLSSLMQGVLMERIDATYADHLHMSSIHPYSQYVTANNDEIIWTVNCLNDEAEEMICPILMNDSFLEVQLKHRDESLTVLEKSCHSISYQSLIDDYYLGHGERSLRLKCLTPTSFKQNGKYCLFPSIRLIFQSLMKKFDACSEKHSIYSDEILEHYEKYAQIVDYRLRSTRFHLEGVKIPSFVGELTIHVNGPQQMVNMAEMLAEFGAYSGVGIKCSMGMGALQLIKRNKQEKEGDA